MEQSLPKIPTLEGLIYSRPNIVDFTLDDNNLHRTCPLDNGRHPKVDLGVLENLPLELLCSVLVQIDLQSLTNFRCLNQRAMQVVDSIPQYQTIVKHARAPLRGIMSVEMGSHISCEDLFHTLLKPKCEECNDFGGFIYILTCSRVCFLCLSEEAKYLPLLVSEAARLFGIDRRLLASLPRMRSIPGQYSPNERRCRSRLVLVDPEAAHFAGVTLHGSAQAMEQHVSKVTSKRLEEYHKRVLRKATGKTGPTPRRPPIGKAIDGHSSNPKRFMGIVRAPYVDPSMNSIEWGFHCVGCQREHYSRPLHWRRKYTTDTFNEHLKECGYIKDGVHSLSRSLAT